jgi:biotin transport system substrate-specific component
LTQTTLVQTLWPGQTGTVHASKSTDWRRDAVLMLTFSLVMALSAQLAVLLPFSPVRVTGQTFGVLLTGALLGPRLGFLTLLLYLVEGGIGLPFFAAGLGGPARLLGPAGGYLLAFPLAAAVVGYLASRGWDRRPQTMLAAMLVGSLIIYALGAAQLSMFPPLRPGATPGLHMGLAESLREGVLLFLPGDAIKAVLAAGLLPLGWKCIGAKR